MQAIESLKQAGFDIRLEDEKVKYKPQSRIFGIHPVRRSHPESAEKPHP